MRNSFTQRCFSPLTEVDFDPVTKMETTVASPVPNIATPCHEYPSKMAMAATAMIRQRNKITRNQPLLLRKESLCDALFSS